MVILAVLIAFGIMCLIFKLFQTSLTEFGVSAKVASIIGLVVIGLFLIACYIH